MLFQRKKTTPPEKPLYGVNLGGWLVLEKWMTPSLFEGLEASDEYTYCQLSGSDILPRLKKHRDTFITLMDFEWLKAQGVDAVRLPVGYWVFGDEPPYDATIEYVDKAFAWAKETGLKILLDMHGAPGSQNGWDHSGRSGACSWHKDEKNIIKTLNVLTRLTTRYKTHKSLLGIELLNEPRASVPKRKLLKYYEAAYKMIRTECGDDVWVVFSDGFRPHRWKRKLKGRKYVNVYIDTHQYQTFNKKDKQLDLPGHMHKTLVKLPKLLGKMSRRHKVIIGEWSLALDPLSLRDLNSAQIEAARQVYGAAQFMTFASTAAWFYWSYKTEEGGVWSFRDTVEKHWLPPLK